MISQLIGFILGIVASIVAAVLVGPLRLGKFFDKITGKWFRKWDLKKIFTFQGEVIIATSIVSNAPKKTTRTCDNYVEKQLLQYFSQSQTINTIQEYNYLEPSLNLITIGSPRYNNYAEGIQKSFDLGFEFIYDSYEPAPADKILKLVSKYGDEFSSSEDLKVKREGLEVDYGILFIVCLKNEKKIIWIAGIHGIGTLGVSKYLLEHPKKFKSGYEEGVGKIWLFRVRYDNNIADDFRYVQNVELIGGGYECPLKKSDIGIKTFLCDFGNVIMFFDRDRTYRAIGNIFNLNYLIVKQIIEENNDLKNGYENGEISSQDYHKRILQLFERDENELTFELFREIYGDIFWLNSNMVEALKLIKKQCSLVLLSNTNEIHFNTFQSNYSDVLSIFDHKLLLSYKVGMLKPDQIIFHEAASMGLPGSAFNECVYVDDISEYVKVARGMGMKGIVYYSYTQFISALRKLGIYIP